MSAVRIGIIMGIIGIVLLGAGVFSFYADVQSRRAPLDVALFPQAQQWGFTDGGTGRRTTYFRAPGVDPVAIAAFYQAEMQRFYGTASDAERCIRNPSVGDNPVPADIPNAIPFEYRCMFDRSGMGASQYTLIRIYPGLANANPELDAAGAAVVVVEQVWQP
jgi:hypothetical protein